MAKFVVGTVDEILPGERKIVEVAGRSIGIFNVDGEFFALRNSCPHQNGPLCLGKVHGVVRARVPGEYDYSRAGELLRCPWHGWEFDVRTGQSWFDPQKTRVRRYEVQVAAPAEVATLSSELETGPYVAETYPVSVEQRLILVEVRT